MSAPVTMAEIDEAREVANERLSALRFARAATLRAPTLRGYEAELAGARDRVEELLRRWWAQGCREVPRG